MVTGQPSLSLPPSLWASTAPAGPSCPALDSDVSTDVAVIGAGFTGLSTALHLAAKSVSVRVIEAGEPGWGASGRNGGQVNPGWYISPDRIRALYGADHADRVLDAVAGACDRVFDLIERHHMDCEAVRPGYIQGVRGAGGSGIIDSKIRQWSMLGAPVEFLDKKDMDRLTGTRAYLCGMLDKRGGNLNPLAYARGLARAAISAGAHVHGQSRVMTVVKHADGYRVETERGSVRASRVVFATNAYTDGAWPGLRQSVVPVASVIAATEPLSDDAIAGILPWRHAVSETARVFYYYKRDAHGRFLIGCKGPAFAAPDADRALRGRAAAERFFPSLNGVRWEYGWGGYVAVTPDMRPRLMQLAPGVTAALGYQGRGVAMATEMGYELAEQLTGGDARIPVSGIRRVPFHWLSRPAVFARILGGRFLDRVRPI
ncbi:MAG: FAD-binding oxidoreductase [Proteobacteria bacterium]|nr:MAG: FAD-binding oxidoreductase [Pseudomonadota bacterium]